MIVRTPGVLVLGLIVGALAGYTAVAYSSDRALQKQLVEGHGRAVTSLRVPGEAFTFRLAGGSGEVFTVVPRGKVLLLTDVMYIAQGSLRQDVTVNVSRLDDSRAAPRILFQVRISPGESHEVHLCSGYVIPEGHSVVSYTGASAAPGQNVSLAATGYLVDASEPVPAHAGG